MVKKRSRGYEILRYIVFGYFAFSAVIRLVGIVFPGLYFGDATKLSEIASSLLTDSLEGMSYRNVYFPLLSSVFIAGGILLRDRKFAFSGHCTAFIMQCISYCALSDLFKSGTPIRYFFGALAVTIVSEIPAILLAVSSLCKGKKANVFAVLACVSYLIGSVQLISAVMKMGGNSWLITLTRTVMTGIMYFLLGIVYSKMPSAKKARVNQNVSSVTVVQGSQIERLSRLKDLLDKEIITQEEFDAKKKEIMEQ